MDDASHHNSSRWLVHRSTSNSLQTETQVLVISFESMRTVCYLPDFNVNMTETNGVTYSTIGPSITTSPPEQWLRSNSHSGGVEALPVISMDSGDSSSLQKSGAILALPWSRPPSVIREEMEDPSGSLFEEQGAGCRHGFHQTPPLLTHQSII